MIPEQYKQTAIYQFIVQQKYLVMLIAASIVMLIIVLVLSIKPSAKGTPTQMGSVPNGTAQVSPSPTMKKTGFSLFNPLSLFTPQNKTSPTPSIHAGSSHATSQTGAAPISSSISTFGGRPLTGTTSIGGGIVATNPSRTTSSGGSSSGPQNSGTSSSGTGSNNVSQGTTGNSPTPTPTPRPDILILFQNPDGTITNYVPPGTPPIEVRWGRYINHQDNYAIDYPINWQIEIFTVVGHQGVTVYAPGANKKAVGTPYIGFGITNSYFHLAQSQLANAFDTSVFVSDIPGTLYTKGPLGSSYIASIFPYQNGHFGLGTNTSDESFAYVYYYMLHSLRFNVQ